jgi:hypothetical protein
MTKSLSRTAALVAAARILFLLNAAVWIALAILTVTRMAGGSCGSPLAAWIMAALMAGNAVVMLWFGVRLGRAGRRTYVVAIAFLLVNIFLTITDEFGLWDGITLAIDVALLALLIASRSRYMQNHRKVESVRRRGLS